MIHVERQGKGYIDVKCSGDPLEVLTELEHLTAAIMDSFFGDGSDKVLDQWPNIVRNARKRSTRVCGSLLDLLDNTKLGGDKE